jgi:hypothetical protein
MKSTDNNSNYVEDKMLDSMQVRNNNELVNSLIQPIPSVVTSQEHTQASMYDTKPSKPKKPIVMPEKFSGCEGIEEYIYYFESVAQINDWSGEDKAKCLSVCLVGNARQLLSNKINFSNQGYDTLKALLLKHYGCNTEPSIHMAKLNSKQRHENETIPDLTLAIKQLAKRAYKDKHLTDEQIDNLSIRHFIDSLNDSAQRKHVSLLKPQSLDEAANIALEFETINFIEKSKEVKHTQKLTVNDTVLTNDRPATIKEVARVESQISKLQNQVNKNNQKPVQSNECNNIDNLLQEFRNEIVNLKEEMAKLKCNANQSYGRQQNRNYKQSNFYQSYEQQQQPQQDKLYSNTSRRSEGCYICGAMDHFKYSCPRNWRRTTNEANYDVASGNSQNMSDQGNGEQRESMGPARASQNPH